MHRSRLLALLVVALGACRPASSTTSPATPDAPAPADPFPSTAAAWTAREYLQFRDALVRLERERPDLLPRRGAPVFVRLTSLPAIEAAAAGADTDALLDLGQALGEIAKIYSARALVRGEYGDEYAATAAVFVKLSGLQLARMVADQILEVAVLRAEPVRREGFVKMRFHLARLVHDVLAVTLALPQVVDARRSAAAVAAVVEDVAPWFLPEERDLVLGLVDRLEQADVGAGDIAELRRALAPDREPHALVAAFADEHRAYGERQAELLATVAAGLLDPLEVGREAAGTRYAFPEAGFSAVYPQRPNAQQHVSTATDGAAVTMRALGTKDALGVTRSVSCFSRPHPLPGATAAGSLDQFVTSMKLGGVRRIELDGAAGVEGHGESATARALVRYFQISDTASCMVIFECPLHLAGELADDARRFVDSFALGGFRG